MSESIDRRRFVKLGAGGLAALAVGSTLGTAEAAPPVLPKRIAGEPWVEADLAQLRRLMRRGLSSTELTEGYLDRIARLNPVLHAVIETNPDALRIARRRDAEWRNGHRRGPLHGIPVLIKDNIATDDGMETTAGSLALVGAAVPADAPVVLQLRRAGAVILGKTNLSEWANFRGFAPFNGWSARGGFTRNPYDLGLDPSGSSSGSGSAVAASLSAVAVGTETDGSILSPSAQQSVVGYQADRRAGVRAGHHSHRPIPGHGRTDGAHRGRRSLAARRPAGAGTPGDGTGGAAAATRSASTGGDCAVPGWRTTAGTPTALTTGRWTTTRWRSPRRCWTDFVEPARRWWT